MTGMISFIIPCLNEENQVVRCLDNIAGQTYPQDRIEVIFADGHSSDRTRILIDDWAEMHDLSVRVIDNDKVVAEFGSAAALRHARGDYVCIQGCDHEIVPADALETFVEALTEFPEAAGVEQETIKAPNTSWFNKYAAVTGWCDPLARELTGHPKLVETRQVRGRQFHRLRFPGNYPVILFFRRSAIETYMGKDTFEEGQVMLDLGVTGNNQLVRIDGYGFRHHHATSFRGFLKKRLKIAKKYSTRVQERRTWVQHTGRRIYLFAFLHLTILYPLIYSIIRALREREPLWLYHAPLCFATTATYIFSSIWIKLTRKTAW